MMGRGSAISANAGGREFGGGAESPWEGQHPFLRSFRNCWRVRVFHKKADEASVAFAFPDRKGLPFFYCLGRKKPRCFSEMGIPKRSITASMSSQTLRFSRGLSDLSR